MSGEETDSIFRVSSLLAVYRIPILLGVFSLFCIVLSITIFIKSYQSSQPVRFSSDGISDVSYATGSGVVSDITVDIEGAVMNPGVYTLPSGSRVEDGIAKAGGLGKSADTAAIARNINRAAKLSDGAKLYVPTRGQQNAVVSEGGTAGRNGPVLINTASQAELEALPGVGAATAGKIIAGRPYLNIQELVEKKAMSQSLFTKLKDLIGL